MPEFYIPSQYAPKWVCNICGQRFYSDERQAREAHAVKCIAEHHDELVAQSPKNTMGLFRNPADPEYFEWVRRNGRVA